MENNKRYNKKLDEFTIQKTLRIPESLVEKIDRLASQSDRDFSKQVNFMLKEYIRIKEG